MLNVCILVGNLGEDPNLHYSSSGEPVCNFNMAFQASKKKTGWIRVVCFSRLSEICETYLHRGARVAVTGLLDMQTWQGEDGNKRTSFQLIASNIEFVKTDKRGVEEDQGEDGTPF
jgi:single-strand DNA-binding protein